MKKYFSFFMFALLLAMGCSEDYSTSAAKDGDSFIFNEGTYLTPTIDSEGGVLAFGFKCNTAWSVVESEEWLEVKPASGDATANNFEVAIAKNRTGEQRVATISVLYGKKSIDICLTQFAELCAANEIAYRTTSGQTIAPNTTEGFGSNIVENVYENGYGKLRFEGDVKSIPAEVFKGCSDLALIIIPRDLESIGDSAFEGCTSLVGITIGDSVTTIGNRAFYECRSLKSATIGQSVTTIGTEAFYLCAQLESIAIPAGVESISNYTFYNCISLLDVTLDEGIESIGSHCFALCSALTSVAIPDSVTTIGNYAFSDCTVLAEVTLGAGVKSLGDNAFASCSALSNIVLPEGLKNIGGYAFSNCTKIYSIAIPADVESIGDCAFFNCSSLYSVDCLAATAPTLGRYAFHKYEFDSRDESGEAGNIEDLSYAPIGCIIYVPTTAVEAYKTAENWSDYATYIQAK